MNMRIMNRVFLSMLTVSMGLMLSASGWAQDEVAIELEKRGRVELESRSYPAALEQFAEAAARASDPKLKARLDFRRAVTLQQMAGDSELSNPQEQLEQATELYRSYLEINPQSAAAANNLAKVYEQLGQQWARSDDPSRARIYYQLAAEHYERAVGEGGSGVGLYLYNYASFLEHIRSWDRAKKIYSRLIAEQPLSDDLQQTLAESYSQHGLQDLAEYLWQLLDAGYVRQSTELALKALQETLNASSEHRIGLLTIVCVSLAERTDDYIRLINSETRNDKSPLVNDDFLGKGVIEILRLHKGQALDRESYAWWKGRDFQSEDPEFGVWPLDGFRTLIRSLGSRSKYEQNFVLAESYFRLAADLNPWDIDPMAVRGLVQMFAENNQFAKIDEALSKYEVQLIRSKNGAYMASSAKKIFLFHQTLGELYALIERWGDTETLKSAIFQLERARRFSQTLAEDTPEPLPEKYQFTPPMVEMLASGYESTKQPVKAAELRVKQAEIYRDTGDINAATRVLTPVREADLSPNYKTRFESLKASPELNLQLQQMNVEGAVLKDSQG